MTDKQIKEYSYMDLLGYLTSLYEDCDCTCKCKVEVWSNFDVIDDKTCEQLAEREKESCIKSGCYETCPERMAYERVAEALAKQIPMKPKFYDDGYDFFGCVNLFSVRCPRCQEGIVLYSDNELDEDDCTGDIQQDFYKHSMINIGYVERKNSYCACCGQKLDWSD